VATDPLVHHGRHFGRAVHTFCNVRALIVNGLIRMVHENPPTLDTLEFVTPACFFFSHILPREIREDRAFQELIRMCPGMKERLAESTDEDIRRMADSVSHPAITYICFLSLVADTKGDQWRPRRRHKRTQRRDHRVDQSTRSTA
jgi:hypothetical protein